MFAHTSSSRTPTHPQDEVFDVQIVREGDAYHVYSSSKAAGEANASFRRPVSDADLNSLLAAIGQPRRSTTNAAPTVTIAADKVRGFGERLFRAVFAEDVGIALRETIFEAEKNAGGVAIRLKLHNVPELEDLPWEFLYDPSRQAFLALSRRTRIVRYVPMLGPIQALAVEPPLSALVLMASPAGYEPLDTAGERKRIEAAVAPLTESGLLRLEVIEHATLSDFRARLQRGTYHLVHFIGHGGVDPDTQEGVLLFEDGAGQEERVYASQFGQDLIDARTIKLVVLNSCEGARTSPLSPFANTAERLVTKDIPAVVAMQFEISDAAAQVFAQFFYRAIASFLPVDEALGEARKEIDRQTHGLEWATPTLYMRSEDGRIFEQSVKRRSLRTLLTSAPDIVAAVAVLVLVVTTIAAIAVSGILVAAHSPAPSTFPGSNSPFPSATPQITPAESTPPPSTPSVTPTPASTAPTPEPGTPTPPLQPSCYGDISSEPLATLGATQHEYVADGDLCIIRLILYESTFGAGHAYLKIDGHTVYDMNLDNFDQIGTEGAGSGERQVDLLGRPIALAKGQTFTLDLSQCASCGGLSVYFEGGHVQPAAATKTP